MKRLPMYLLYTLSTLLLLAAVKPLPATARQVTPVIVQQVRTAEFGDRVEALGTLRANETVDITATVSDTITVIHFEDGQRVEQGDILVEMTSREEHARLEEEKSTFTEAEKQYDRLKILAENGAVATSLLDEKRRDYDSAGARLRAIESQLKDRLILAPFGGVLGLRDISVGALIEPGDVITTLDDDTVMKLDFDVPSIHLAALHTSMPVTAEAAAFPGKKFSGEISSIDSRIDPATRTVTVRAIIANPERLLKPGLLMRVLLRKNPRTGVAVPEESLIPLGKENFVLVVKTAARSAVAERRKVKTGVRWLGDVEILSGLAKGEVVVTHGTLRVRPGQEVVILAEEQGDEPLDVLLSGANGGDSP